METKKCPYCGGEIMAVAKKCKHCGQWLDENAHPIKKSEHSEDNSREPEQESDDTADGQDGGKTAIILVAAFIGFCIILIPLLIAHNYALSRQTDTEEYDEDAATPPAVVESYNEIYTDTSDVPEEEPAVNLQEQRYQAKYEEVHIADIHLMRADGKKLWYNYWTPSNESGYDNKLYIYDSETDRESTVRLNKTSMPDSEMEVSDMVEHNGIITIIMTENRNSNGWIDGTYVWQYNCDTDTWHAIARGCSGAEFVNNRTAVKLKYAEPLNPDDPVYLQEYSYTHRTLNI